MLRTHSTRDRTPALTSVYCSRRRTAARVPAVEEMVRGREAASGWASLTRLQARLGLSSEELKAIVLRLPQLLGESYEATVAPPLEALQARLRLSDPQLRRLVTKLPQLQTAAVFIFSMKNCNNKVCPISSETQ